MIEIDIPLPECCDECPCSHWIWTGKHKGKLMCNALESRDKNKETERYLVDEMDEHRPWNCPILTKKEVNKPCLTVITHLESRGK